MNRLSSRRHLLPVRRDALRVSVDDDHITVVDPGGREHHLNPTAYALWVLCDGETAEAEMVDAVRTLFAIDLETATHDVTSALDRFDEAELIEWHDPEEVP